LVNVSGLCLDLPVYGEDRAGKIKAAEINIVGMTPLSDYEQEVMWRRPLLEIKEDSMDAGGVMLRLRAQFSPQRGKVGSFPFSIEMEALPQQVQSLSWLQHHGLDMSARGLAIKSQLVGLASNPLTWQGKFLTWGHDLTVTGLRGNQRLPFDELRLPVILRGGKLYCGDARLVGEDLSLMGNGHASMQGGMLAVTRLVASPEIATELAKSIHRAGVAEGAWWHELETPDRLVRDLTVSGSLYQPIVDAGDNYAGVRLTKLLGPLLRTAASRVNDMTARLDPLPGHEPSQSER